MMVSPKDVDLLIFDTDGTITPTTRPVYDAIRKVFASLNWPVTFSSDDIQKFFGITGGELYKFIAPDGEDWQDIRDKAREEYAGSFREYGETYPGVKDTLKILRKRGYRLVLYSNASPVYFNTVKSALEIEDYFDYTECIGENNLTKPELIRKIKKKFGGIKATVVGDRYHDIEAAAETGSLSIGAMYGYGGNEPEKADVVINKFPELLNVFDRKQPIFERIADEISARKQSSKPFVVGVNGIDTSGKTLFTDSLAWFLTSHGRDAQVINLDDFHNPRHIRNSGGDQVESYYMNGFDIGTLVERLLVPIREKGEYSVSLTLLDLHTDRYEVEKTYSFTEDTIVLLEGVYLFRKEISPYIDYKIFLDMPFEESKRRAATRDVKRFGGDIMKKYDEKYFPVQKRYLREYPPRDIADMIIDNTNWEYPVIDFTR